MKNYLIPALGIIIVAVILVIINEFTDSTFVKDYALILIIAGMLLGLVLSKVTANKKDS